ncbi:hypothetical protein [Nocardia colli]|uniref:hypothetical protein n=1 Tax=Nocardia colli TaxID=2545717 RepID=UPI0035E1B9D5
MSINWYIARDIILTPQTFFKPTPVKVSAMPEEETKAPGLPYLGSTPAIIAFLRHTGCPFAEATLRQLADFSSRYPNVDFIAVTHSGEARSQAWCDSFGGIGSVSLLPDPERLYYARWGVGLSDREHFAGKESMAEVRRLFSSGVHNRPANGSRWQMATTFSVDAAKIIRWRHVPRHAGDLPPLDDALASIAR